MGKEIAYKVQIGRQQIYYRCLGSGPPLVLVHGYGTSGYLWQRSLPFLSQQRQVFVVDLPGHGQSKLGGPWRLREVAPLLEAWLRQMALPPVALAGHSMGGAICIHLAAYAPDLVQSLVLVNAAGFPLQTTLPALSIRALRSSLQWGNGSYPLPLLRDMMRFRPRVLWQAARQMLNNDFHAELRLITAPTLILWGERDVLLPLALGRSLSAAIPHATFITLPGCGHRPPLAQPAVFSRLVLEFLAKSG